jgi:fatty-acyl-CoA synthase
VISTVELRGAGEDEATLVSVPPYHIAGISAQLSSTYAGRRVVQLEAFDPAGWVQLARRESVTHAMVVPTMLGRILGQVEADGGGLPACGTCPTAVAGCPSRWSSGRCSCCRGSISSTRTA